MSAGRVVAAVVIASALAPATARAEEGLFVARIVGGASAARPEMSEAGGLAAVSANLCVTERTGVVASVEHVWRDTSSAIAFGVALQHLPYEGEWTRVYVYAGPAALVSWGGAAEARSSDLAGQAGLGVEYLMMWGLGVALEARGTLPAGLRASERLDGASVSLGAGLFTEF